MIEIAKFDIDNNHGACLISETHTRMETVVPKWRQTWGNPSTRRGIASVDSANASQVIFRQCEVDFICHVIWLYMGVNIEISYSKVDG